MVEFFSSLFSLSLLLALLNPKLGRRMFGDGWLNVDENRNLTKAQHYRNVALFLSSLCLTLLLYSRNINSEIFLYFAYFFAALILISSIILLIVLSVFRIVSKSVFRK